MCSSKKKKETVYLRSKEIKYQGSWEIFSKKWQWNFKTEILILESKLSLCVFVLLINLL